MKQILLFLLFASPLVAVNTPKLVREYYLEQYVLEAKLTPFPEGHLTYVDPLNGTPILLGEERWALLITPEWSSDLTTWIPPRKILPVVNDTTSLPFFRRYKAWPPDPKPDRLFWRLRGTWVKL